MSAYRNPDVGWKLVITGVTPTDQRHPQLALTEVVVSADSLLVRTKVLTVASTVLMSGADSIRRGRKVQTLTKLAISGDVSPAGKKIKNHACEVVIDAPFMARPHA